MTEMDWTRPPSDYVVEDGETGERFEIDQIKWGTADVFGRRAIRFADRQLWTFGADGHGLHGMNIRLVIRSEVEKPDPTIDDPWAKFNLWFFRECNEGTRRHLFAMFGYPVEEIASQGIERKVFHDIKKRLAASLADWRG